MSKRSVILLVSVLLYCSVLNGQAYKDSLLTLIAQSKVDSLTSKLYRDLARRLYENTDYQNAKLYNDSAFYIAQRSAFTPGIIDYYQLNGRLLKNSGKYDEAKYSYDEALSLSLQSKDTLRIARSFNNLGNVLTSMHQYDTAYAKLLLSIQFYNKIKEIKSLAHPLSNIGKIHLDFKRYDSAVYYYEKTVAIASAFHDHFELAQTFKRLAMIYFETNNFERAVVYCDSSLGISRQHNYRYIIADDYDILAKIFLAKKDYRQAREMLNKSLKLYLEMSLKPSIPYCYKQLSNLDTIEGNYRDAYRHFKLYHLYNDSLVDLENRISMEKQRARSLAEFNQLTAERKSRILMVIIGFLVVITALIVYIIRQRQIVAKKMAIALMKNRISQDLHDEVGSALSSISMQTEVLKKRIRNKEPIDDLIELIKAVSRNSMSTMNDIVWSLNTGSDNLSQFLNRLRNFCSIALGTSGIHYEIEIDESMQIRNADLQLFKEVYLVAKECINNCMKYAKATHVVIRLHKSANIIQFSMQDNGVGFDQENLPLSFGGEGIKNMRRRAKSIHADFKLISSPGKGTLVELSWKDVI